jgi:hypothetical protein
VHASTSTTSYFPMSVCSTSTIGLLLAWDTEKGAMGPVRTAGSTPTVAQGWPAGRMRRRRFPVGMAVAPPRITSHSYATLAQTNTRCGGKHMSHDPCFASVFEGFTSRQDSTRAVPPCPRRFSSLFFIF